MLHLRDLCLKTSQVVFKFIQIIFLVSYLYLEIYLLEMCLQKLFTFHVPFIDTIAYIFGQNKVGITSV